MVQDREQGDTKRPGNAPGHTSAASPAGRHSQPGPGTGVAEVFGSSGALARAHPSYERRDGQEEMALAVEQTLRDGGVLLIEAGTGVGKTLAYLVPAALSGKRVIISTGTKTLQDQIAEKDLPFVARRLGIALTSAVLKGRENYLCLRRYEEFEREPLLPTIQESDIYENLRKWAKGTKTGDRGEAAGLPDDVSFWRKINARGDTCTGTKCEDYESCWLTAIRRKAEASRIVVVNHHLFFADLALRGDAFGKVLPDYDIVIFDEAHLIEETATLFFGVSTSSARVLELADDGARLLGGARGGISPGRRDETATREAGDLSQGPLRRQAEAGSRGEGWSARGEGSAEGAARGGGESRGRSGGGRTGSPGRGSRSGRAGRGPVVIEAEDLKQAATALFGPLSAGAARRLLDDSARGPEFKARHDALQRAIGSLGSAAEAVNPPTDESSALARRCREIASQLEFIARGDDERFVYWSETRGRTVTLTASPVDVSDLLGETLFSHLHAAVLTSATLSVGGSFEFVRSRLGAAAGVERIVPSPFDYGKQTVLYLPPSMPEPRAPGYSERMLREIEALVAISRGRAFLLFTSHAELRRVEAALRGRTRHPVLVQGEKPRARLLEEFRSTGGAILLGAASFWHGVDVAGEALSLVVIDRIPFDVPNDPLVAARIDRIRKLGGDPFGEYQVPSAAIELKQGLGRLIRSRADRGILAVLDARLRTRGYGRRLLASLPPFPVVTDIEEVRRFFVAP